MLTTEDRLSESPWTLPAVSLVLVAMLVAFYAVVSSAAEAGEKRRKSVASEVAAVKHCRSLPSWDASKSCLKQLNTGPAPEAAILVASN